MKAFKLMMMAGLLAFAGSAQAQIQSLTANDISGLKAGETAELVISLDYESTDAELCGTNFSISFPDGIVLDGFDSKDAMLAGTKKKLSKAAFIDEEENPWGEDFGNDMIYDFKGKTDGGLLLILMDSDKSPFITKKCKLITLTLTALEDVSGTGKIYSIGFTDTNNVSVGLGEHLDYEFGINTVTDGINDIKSADATTPAYNLQGVRVNNAKGLIIRDGKKVIVK